jgi:hypothetical protein
LSKIQEKRKFDSFIIKEVKTPKSTNVLKINWIYFFQKQNFDDEKLKSLVSAGFF